MAGGFPGENVKNGSVLVVKTHFRPGQGFNFTKAVLLVRDMSDAGVAENNRRRGGHTGEARASAYTDQRELIRTGVAITFVQAL